MSAGACLFSGLAGADGCASLRSAQRRARVRVRAALSYDNRNQPCTASAEPQTKALKTASQLNPLSTRGLGKTGTQQPRSPLRKRAVPRSLQSDLSVAGSGANAAQRSSVSGCEFGRACCASLGKEVGFSLYHQGPLAFSGENAGWR